jgi:hypothetical protein
MNSDVDIGTFPISEWRFSVWHICLRYRNNRCRCRILDIADIEIDVDAHLGLILIGSHVRIGLHHGLPVLGIVLLLPKNVTVPDSGRRIIPEVVLVRARGSWGSGNLEGWVKGGTREVSLQATWDWGGRILSQLGGFQVSRRGYKRGEGGTGKGRPKARGMRRV